MSNALIIRMKKTSVIRLLILAAYQSSRCQTIGINATGAAPNALAILDVSSSTKRPLALRVALITTTALTPVGTALTNLLVYNNAMVQSGEKLICGFIECMRFKYSTNGKVIS